MQFSMMGQQIFVSIKSDTRNTHSTKVSEFAPSIITFVDLTINFSVSGEFFGGGALKGFTLITQKSPRVVISWQVVPVAVPAVLLSILEQESSGAMLTLVWQGEIPSTVLGKVKE